MTDILTEEAKAVADLADRAVPLEIAAVADFGLCGAGSQVDVCITW